MSEINDQSSDTSSELNWPIDHPMERIVQLDRVVFENVADQYVKGEDVTAFFTILQDVKVNPTEDQIGLLRVGSTKINECIAHATVQFNPSTASGSTFHGTATFPSSSLPVTDDEFYQFCYIINKTKNIGSSIPFQLNCALDDIDLLSNAPVSKSKSDGLIALADQDNDDVVVIHTRRMLTEEKIRQENRHLLEMNRRVELQRDECQTKYDLFQLKSKQDMEKLNHDIQTLTASYRTTADELLSRKQTDLNLRAEFDSCQSLCKQYQIDSLRHAERSRTLEEAQIQISNEANQLRSQLAVTSQLAKDQATQIINLERLVMQSNELAKTSNQRQTTLEQQIRDLRLTSEKHHLSTEGQINEYTKQIQQQTDRIQLLETDHHLLNEENNTLKDDNERLTLESKHDKVLIEDLEEQLHLQHLENELIKNEREVLQNQLDEIKSNQQSFITLTSSFEEIKKRCLKHQKSEVEVKRQLAVYQNFINELQQEKQELVERLSTGAQEYKTLFRKCSMLEHKLGMDLSQEIVNIPPPTPTVEAPLNEGIVLKEEEIVPTLCNTAINQVEEEEETRSSFQSISNVDEEVRACPMCFWQFPVNISMDAKREHVENHFAN